jgi:UDP-N-acetylglucosamine 2-epimerase
MPIKCGPNENEAIVHAREWASRLLLNRNGKLNINWAKRIILVTAHRRENFGPPLENICAALREIASHYQAVHIVYPVHLNPNVQGPVHRLLGSIPNHVMFSDASRAE